jgi:hypothetical protein
MYVRTSVAVLFMTFLLVNTIVAIIEPIPHTNASSKSPYESGYDHGCHDAKISDPSDMYINQPEKGPLYHTQEFMNGYHTGFNACYEIDSLNGNITRNTSTFVVKVTVVHPENEVLKYNEANIYIGEYPEYNVYVGSFSDVFYNYNPLYDPNETYEFRIPLDLVDSQEELHVCIEGLNRGMLKECYSFKNSPGNAPEHITIEI